MTQTKITYRLAKESDMPAVHTLIRELALYEKAPECVTTTTETFVQDGFSEQETPWFTALVAAHETDGVVGAAIFFKAYSTWQGRVIYLDDLIVTEAHRGQGIGKALMNELFAYANTQDAVMVKWQVLDWNQPAINVYKKMGARLNEEWINCRMDLVPAKGGRQTA